MLLLALRGRAVLLEGIPDRLGGSPGADDFLTTLDGDDELVAILSDSLNVPVVPFDSYDFHTCPPYGLIVRKIRWYLSAPAPAVWAIPICG